MTTAIEYIRDEIDTDDFRDAVAAIGPLTLRQRATVRALTTACRLVRLRYLAQDKSAFLRRLVPPLPREMTMHTRPGPDVDAAECAAFAQTGVAGPFRAVSGAEAEALLAHCRGALRDPHSPFYRVLRQAQPGRAARMLRDEDIILGLNRYMYDPRLQDVLASQPVIGRIAAFMGTDDVSCWRSQFFRQRSGGKTDLHQNIDFLDSLKQKTRVHLRPGRVFHPNSILNAWVSLTEATVETGCVRLLPGTFTDTRIYDLAWSFNKRPADLVAALSFLPDRVIAEMVTIALYSAGGHRGTTRGLFKLADFFYDDLLAQEAQFADFVSKPGEFWVFSSFNMHGSHAFTGDGERFTLVGRYANMDTLDIEGDRFEIELDGTLRIDPEAHGWTSLLRARAPEPTPLRAAR